MVAETEVAVSSAEPIHVTDETFEEVVLNSQLPVLVDFWAPWCGPCKMITPVIEEISNDYAGRAVVAKVNTDEHRQAAMEFGISAIPTLILFKGGQIERKWVGLTGKKDITQAIDELL
jgi:thioredoxin 1